MHQSPTAHVFYHPDLIKIWIRTYLPLRNLTSIFVWGNSEDGNQAFIPLVLWKKDWKGAFIKSIIPIGYSDYDYHDPLFTRTCNNQELASFWNCLVDFLKSYKADEIILDGVRDQCCSSDNPWTKEELCPLLNISSLHDENDLMLFFKTKLRGDIRRQLRRLNEIGNLRYIEYDSADTLPESLFEKFMEAHKLKWPQAYKAPHFHKLLVSTRNLNGPIHFSAILLNDTPIAWHLGFEFQNIYYYYMPAGNPDYQKYSPVKIHLYFLIVRAINKNYKVYDHLRGDEAYKSGWSDGKGNVNTLHITRKSFSTKIT